MNIFESFEGLHVILIAFALLVIFAGLSLIVYRGIRRRATEKTLYPSNENSIRYIDIPVRQSLKNESPMTDSMKLFHSAINSHAKRSHATFKEKNMKDGRKPPTSFRQKNTED